MEDLSRGSTPGQQSYLHAAALRQTPGFWRWADAVNRGVFRKRWSSHRRVSRDLEEFDCLGGVCTIAELAAVLPGGFPNSQRVDQCFTASVHDLHYDNRKISVVV